MIPRLSQTSWLVRQIETMAASAQQSHSLSVKSRFATGTPYPNYRLNLLKRALRRTIIYTSRSNKIKEKSANTKNEKKLQRVFRKAARLQMKLEKYYDRNEIIKLVLEDYTQIDGDDPRKKKLRKIHITLLINSLELGY